MNQTIAPGPRSGRAEIPASKSRAHRLLICAALYGGETALRCRGISKDILATMDCLRAAGCRIRQEGELLLLQPAEGVPEEPVTLPCGESGSTLRFLLPVAGALGLRGAFRMEGRLPERPMQPLEDVLREKGMRISREGDRLAFGGRLRPGAYAIPGDVSSQFVSGLLFALPLLPGESTLEVTGRVESADYIAMTEDALRGFGVSMEKNGYFYRVRPATARRTERGRGETLEVEADWSSAAFFLALGALSPEGVAVTGMNPDSLQGDRRILSVLEEFGAEIRVRGGEILARRGRLQGVTVDASGIPDLVPVISAVAAAAEGETVITRAERLRLKESDRLKTTAAMLGALGAEIEETADGLRIRGRGGLAGGEVSAFRDHRIAMSAAVAASVCRSPVTVTGAECTEKSFPGFWELLDSLRKETVS